MNNKYMFLTLIALIGLSCQRDPEIAVFTDQDICDEISVSYTKAHVDAIFSLKTSDYQQYSFVLIYSDDEDFSSSNQLRLGIDGFNPLHWAGDIKHLQFETTYYYKYIVSNDINSYCSDKRSFTTQSYTKNIPLVDTHEVTGISSNTAICSGNVIYDGGSLVSEKGVCYSTSVNPTINDTKVMSLTTGDGAYSCLAENLKSNTTYYVCAYAVNEYGVGYGEQVKFTTLK